VKQIALVGETEHDAREVMIEGVSGILSLYPNGGGPTWISSRCKKEDSPLRLLLCRETKQIVTHSPQ
jgi:phage terminase large subunit-like protein